MQFTFNEGHIQLPSQWQDQSMQVLVSTDNSGINLVITREAVPQGTLTPELYQETLALYQGKLDGYTEHACREITLAEAPAWLLDYSWNGPEDEGNQGRISQISLMDLNEASLNAASTRAGESKIKHKISHDVFEPYPAALHGQFDSISMFYLLHCLPGNISTKSCVIRNAAQALTDDGTLYGATILGDGVVHNSFGQKLMRIYNQKGIFSNTKDSEEGLTHILSEHFENVKTKVQGTVVMFSASGKK